VGITDVETLRAIRRQGHSWRDLPRCGGCGAWTKQDGVCANKRCGGFGLKMAAGRQRDLGAEAAGLGLMIPSPIVRRLTHQLGRGARQKIETVRQSWQIAREHGKYPKDWRQALPAVISELVTVGRCDIPWVGVLASDTAGGYTLDGVPVAAANAGEAARTCLAWLDTLGEVEVKDQAGQLTGETRPRFRYSAGYDRLVDAQEPEPENTFLQGGRVLEASRIPANPPALPKAWDRLSLSSTRWSTVYSNDGQWLVAHRPDSKNYAFLKEGEDFQANGGMIKAAVKVVGSAAASDGSRPVLQRVWGLPASFNSQRHLDAPQGVWAAADGFRLMLMAHDGEEIPGPVNIRPDVGKLIPDGAAVTMGRAGFAWQGQEGHILEAESDRGEFPDFNRIIPAGEPEFSFRITGDVPGELIRAGSPRLAMLEAEHGDVYLTTLVPDDDHPSQKKAVGRVKVGESDNKVVNGRLAGINPVYFNDVARCKPAAGQWTMEVRTATGPLVVKHSSRKAMGAVMPMYLESGY
jgi:hypothetical protein